MYRLPELQKLEMTVDPDDVQPEVFSARDINLEDIEEENLQGIVVLIGCAVVSIILKSRRQYSSWEGSNIASASLSFSHCFAHY